MTSIAIIGGTGPQGKGLGYRFAKGGHDVVLGSRGEQRAALAAAEIAERLLIKPGAGTMTGADNEQAAKSADLVLLAIPFEGHDDLVAGLAPVLEGKVVISCVNPLGFDKKGPFGLDLGPTSAAETAQALLPKSRVIGAFHHLSAASLIGEEEWLDHEDVLVCGDDPDAKHMVMTLAGTVTGREGIDAGALRLARQLEPLTAVLISINKRYRTRAGVAISGVPAEPPASM